MSLTRPALVLLVLSAALSAPRAARAQEIQVPSAPIAETARPPQPKPQNQNVRVDVTIAFKGEKPLSKTLSMVTADGRLAQGRAGIEVPVPTQMFGGGNTNPPVTSYNYRNVAVNVDATPQFLDGGKLVLRLKLNFSTVFRPEPGQPPQPSFGIGSHDVHGIVFESGKPVVIAQSTDAESGRDYTVEVKATILK